MAIVYYNKAMLGKDEFDVIIVGTGPAGLATAFQLVDSNPAIKIVMLDKEKISTGGLRNDCKMNFTYPIGFPTEYWKLNEAESYLKRCLAWLNPPIKDKKNVELYVNRAKKLNVELLEISQAHLGTDGGIRLIKELTQKLQSKGVMISLGEEMQSVDSMNKTIQTDKRDISYKKLVLAPGRKGFHFLQKIMRSLDVYFVDNVVDIGVRIEAREENYPIVKDYYDPKFLFPRKVRTFCTNSGNAHVVQEKYISSNNDTYYSVNGHAWSEEKKEPNGLVNFAMLRTIKLTRPLVSGQHFAEMLGMQAALLGGGHPVMQRVGDFRLGKRSKDNSFNGDLYDFKPTLGSATPGDISLCMPSKILRSIWKSMKELDTILPGILHPSTIMYYPEIKLYANKPQFLDKNFMVKDSIYMLGDGAGTSRGITGAWASGLRAADGILKEGI